MKLKTLSPYIHAATSATTDSAPLKDETAVVEFVAKKHRPSSRIGFTPDTDISFVPE